jgi:hypothetical protein
MNRTVSALLWLLLSSSASANPMTIDYRVDAHDNLFYTDWGHWFRNPGDNGLNTPGSQPAGAVPFDFSGYETLSISAWGTAVEDVKAGVDPDGVCVSNCGSILYPGSTLRAPGLTAYALIGIWSRLATRIDPFYTADNGWLDTTSGLGLLLIGSHRLLAVPDFGSAYLFLAVNDGGFADNDGYFGARITASITEPSAISVLGAPARGAGRALTQSALAFSAHATRAGVSAVDSARASHTATANSRR